MFKLFYDFFRVYRLLVNIHMLVIVIYVCMYLYTYVCVCVCIKKLVHGSCV